MERRKFLLATAASTSLAGCADLVGLGAGPSIEDHFGTDGIENQPTLGLDPSEADNVVVAFEDPSCNICADFHSDGYQKVKSELIEPGKIAYVKRHVEVTRDWATYASNALLATYQRDAEAYEALVDDIFARPTANERGVRARVEAVLEEYDGVSAETVIGEADDGEYDDVVAANDEALERSDADNTPGFLLYGDGHYRTALTGDQEYDVFENHLDV